MYNVNICELNCSKKREEICRKKRGEMIEGGEEVTF
jgi:hypothetical protein